MIRLKNPYILLIGLLLSAFVMFSAWSAYQAASYGSQVSDPAYYSKGLRYNSSRLEIRSAVSQGWQLETTIKQKLLHFRLYDSAGQPISRATGELTLYLPKQRQILLLFPTETEPGIYVVVLPEKSQGSLSARIEFVLQGARISRQLLVNL